MLVIPRYLQGFQDRDERALRSSDLKVSRLDGSGEQAAQDLKT
jgi:hypothetical protein